MPRRRLNDQFKGGFSLASGDLNNPISTNQTLNQYDTRKPIAIDRVYATYTPSWFKPLTLTGGKFAYPWFNTELVWDKDLNPEGAGETLAFDRQDASPQEVQLSSASNCRSRKTRGRRRPIRASTTRWCTASSCRRSGNSEAASS